MLVSNCGMLRSATLSCRDSKISARAASLSPKLKSVASRPVTEAIKIPTMAAIIVVNTKTPTTVPPILPRDFISSTFKTAAIIVTKIRGIMIMRSKFTKEFATMFVHSIVS